LQSLKSSRKVYPQITQITQILFEVERGLYSLSKNLRNLCNLRLNSVRSKFRGLLSNILLCPLVVAACFTRLRSFGGFHLLHQIHVR